MACLAVLGLVGAYPGLFVERHAEGNCTAHPTAALGDHQAPRPDGDARITINGTQASTYCRGASHNLGITLSEERMILVTAGAGRLAGASDECAQRQVWARDNATQTATTIWTAPCNASGNITLRVTSAGSPRDNFHQTSVTLAPDPRCTCAGVTEGPGGSRMGNITTPGDGTGAVRPPGNGSRGAPVPGGNTSVGNGTSGAGALAVPSLILTSTLLGLGALWI